MDKPKEKKFIIAEEQIQYLISVLGEVPAKFSFNALKMLDTLQEQEKWLNF